MEWAAFDLASLQHARPLRAWERKPLTPFSRGKPGAKKIWKRPVAAPASRRLSGTPTKTTKRRCVSVFEGIETQSERLDSPQKRITTRSSHNKTLIALADDEDSEQLAHENCSDEYREDDEPDDVVEGTVIEMLDESGNLVEVHDSADWYDEEDIFDDTLLHLDAAISHEGPHCDRLQADETPNLSSGEADRSVDAQLERETTAALLPLPDGFVSPVRRRRTVSKRLQESNRRKSAPFTFAPQITLHPASAMPQPEEQPVKQDCEQASIDLPQCASASELQRSCQDLAAEESHTTAALMTPKKEKQSSEHIAVELSPAPPVLLTPKKENKCPTSSSPTRQSPRRKLATPTTQDIAYPHIKEFPPSPSPRKPRLSDDTAFLQAFLDRAASNVATKEALEHRQQSATIKEAMTSDKPAILAELSPNVAKFTAVKEGEFAGFDDEEHDEIAADADHPRLRRKTAERSINTAIPTKIMLRSGQPVPPMKATTVNLTRSNTRANKGEAVGPTARLLQLQAELDHSEELADRPTKVLWNDTLDIHLIQESPESTVKPTRRARRALIKPKSAGSKPYLPAASTPARPPLASRDEPIEDKSEATKRDPATTKPLAKSKSRIPSRLPKSSATVVARERDENTSLASPAKRRVSVYDRKLLSSKDTESDEMVMLPLLASPAKKVRKAVIFGTGQLDGRPEKACEPTLASPAKKRSR